MYFQYWAYTPYHDLHIFSGVTYVCYSDSDCRDNNLNSDVRDTVQLCEEWCEETPACAAMVYDHRPAGKCYLKSTCDVNNLIDMVDVDTCLPTGIQTHKFTCSSAIFRNYAPIKMFHCGGGRGCEHPKLILTDAKMK